MEKCYEYQTKIGSFYIVKNLSGYHAVYAGMSIWNCNSANEVASILSDGFKFNFLGAELGEIDTSNLGIPQNLSNWTRCYYMPSHIRGNFKYNSSLKTPGEP